MSDAVAGTPLIEQYEGVKARFPGHLVLFRVGDFYETFGDDAKLLARELEIVLTARSADASGERTPMAGVPHHAVESYLGRLVQKGYKVAICDQVEDARLAKGLVKREVTRVVTPGTVLEDRLLGGPDHNFLVSVGLGPDRRGAFAAVDVSTGEWLCGTASAPGVDALVTALAAFGPREVLLPPFDGNPNDAPLLATLRSEFRNARFETATQVALPDELPEALREAIGAAPSPLLAEVQGRLAAYVRVTQPRLLPFLEPAGEALGVRRLLLDAKTLRHLEIARPMNPDDPSGPTLLGAYDETRTAPGRRTLAFWLKHPLGEVDAIVARQDAVEALVARDAGLEALRSEMRPVADIARIATRLAGRRIRPPELAALASGLSAVERTRRRLLEPPPIGRLAELAAELGPIPGLGELLAAALPDEVPATIDAGPLFRRGFDPEVDRLRDAERAGRTSMERLEREAQEATGIRSLRVGFNQVFGYYLEVSRPNLARVPAHFRRKQTLANAERFTTDELSAVEASILAARDALGEREAERWEHFLTEIDAQVPAIHRLSRALGELDTLATFAHVAVDRGHVRPVVDESTSLQVRDGRHPVLDRTLARAFVPNDTELDGAGARLLILTGPNMSGKSTYMRQVGLFVVLAQAGAFVPAKFARVGLVSSLHTRMGFTDEIGRGKSSFMVEMSEVAEILRDADARSLVLLDEVGRGTSTFDGLALAWATLRHLHDRVRCRTILATHYHQLTELIERLDGARNAHLAVRESAGEVVFLHRLVPGSTDRSYGLHVAKLAGLPPELLQEAQRLLRQLEDQGVGLATRSNARSPMRYTQAVLLATDAPAARSELEQALDDLDTDHLTPMAALVWLAEQRRRLRAAGREP
ncbi:MAG: DNA mismatch repair protein MutS [Thermoplasmata archaeon]